MTLGVIFDTMLYEKQRYPADSGVFEVALKYRTDACRTVYTLQFGERLWVLHAFQKKAKQCIKTPKKDIDLIRERLKQLKKELQQ